MSEVNELSRREFLKRAAALGLVLPFWGCIDDSPILEDPCPTEVLPPDGRQVTCPDGLEALIREDALLIYEDGVEHRYEELMRFGYGTDLHFADRSTTRPALRQGDVKLREAIKEWNEAHVDFAVMGGDYTDPDGGSEKEDVLADLVYLESVFDELEAPRHYVMGNHDLDRLTKEEFLEHSAMEELYYSFDHRGIHFVILDANYSAPHDDAHYQNGEFSHLDIWINPAQLNWLKRDLEATSTPTVVFCHQRLARESGDFANNAADVRQIFLDTDTVTAVFSSHAHENENTVVDGVHYFCMDAMITGAHPSNAYAVVHIYENDFIYIDGFKSQESYLRHLHGRRQ